MARLVFSHGVPYPPWILRELERLWEDRWGTPVHIRECSSCRGLDVVEEYPDWGPSYHFQWHGARDNTGLVMRRVYLFIEEASRDTDPASWCREGDERDA